MTIKEKRELLKHDEKFVRLIKQYNNSNYSYDTFFKGTYYKRSDVKWGLKNKLWELPDNQIYFVD